VDPLLILAYASSATPHLNPSSPWMFDNMFWPSHILVEVIGEIGSARAGRQARTMGLSRASRTKWYRSHFGHRSNAQKHYRLPKVEFEKRDPPPSAMEAFEERLKLNVAIHDFEWSSVAEVAYCDAPRDGPMSQPKSHGSLFRAPHILYRERVYAIDPAHDT
jgi:hypothetical protein